MKKSLLVLIIMALFVSCERFSNESEFRNFVIWEHPYSEYQEVELFMDWGVFVNDTINDSMFFYAGNRGGYEKINVNQLID